MHSACFRNAMALTANLAVTLAECSASFIYVLGKRRRDEDDKDETEHPCKRQRHIIPVVVSSFYLAFFGVSFYSG